MASAYSEMSERHSEDPEFSKKLRNYFESQLGDFDTNGRIPNFIVDNLKNQHDLTLMNVGILGMAFKADIDDIRDSLSYKLVKILKFHGANVFCSDEYVKDPKFITKEEIVEKCDLIIVGVPHSNYSELEIPEDMHVIDLWEIIQKRGAKVKTESEKVTP